MVGLRAQLVIIQYGGRHRFSLSKISYKFGARFLRDGCHLSQNYGFTSCTGKYSRICKEYFIA